MLGCADYRAEGFIAERNDAWDGGLGLGQPDLSPLDGHLRPFQPTDLLLTHPCFREKGE
jgi:hypothetical protein